MAETIRLEVVTPERMVFESNVDSVEVTALDGELGILPGHTELISQLKPAGLLTYHIGNEKSQIAIGGGFVEVGPDKVTVLADSAEKPEEIDLSRALELKSRAEKELQQALSSPDGDIIKATINLERASIQLQLAEGINPK